MTTKNTASDFENAGYSKADAARLAKDPAKNWKAANGGKRQPMPQEQSKAGLTIGQPYKIAAPLPDDRCGEARKHPDSIWVMAYCYYLTKVFNDGTVELQSVSNKDAKPFNIDARRLRGF